MSNWGISWRYTNIKSEITSLKKIGLVLCVLGVLFLHRNISYNFYFKSFYIYLFSTVNVIFLFIQLNRFILFSFAFVWILCILIEFLEFLFLKFSYHIVFHIFLLNRFSTRFLSNCSEHNGKYIKFSCLWIKKNLLNMIFFLNCQVTYFSWTNMTICKCYIYTCIVPLILKNIT